MRFQNTELWDMGRGSQHDPRMAQTLFLQTHPSPGVDWMLRLAQSTHGYSEIQNSRLFWDSEFQVLSGAVKRQILIKKRHCQCSYWNLISRLQHITTLCLPGNSELIIKSISLFMWLGIHLVQRSFMTLFRPKISVIIWSHNPAVPWFSMTQEWKSWG